MYICLAVSDCYFCAPSIPYLLHCIDLNFISHIAALSAISIGRVPCSLCRSVCLLVCWKRLCILEEWLRQLKCHLVWVGPGKKRVKWGLNIPWKGAIFEFHNGRSIVINKNLWYSSVKPCEAIELPFGMVSGVTQMNGVFDGGL